MTVNEAIWIIVGIVCGWIFFYTLCGTFISRVFLQLPAVYGGMCGACIGALALVVNAIAITHIPWLHQFAFVRETR